MNQDEHITFIKSSLLDILHEVVSSANLLGDGMSFFAVHGYLLQSLFLQMTGAQEQKMKCICWELATNNLQYRYYRYYNINEKYLDIVENRLKETLSEEEFDMFNNTLKKIYNELMPEVGFGE